MSPTKLIYLNHLRDKIDELIEFLFFFEQEFNKSFDYSQSLILLKEEIDFDLSKEMEDTYGRE